MERALECTPTKCACGPHEHDSGGHNVDLIAQGGSRLHRQRGKACNSGRTPEQIWRERYMGCSKRNLTNRHVLYALECLQIIKMRIGQLRGNADIGTVQSLSSHFCSGLFGSCSYLHIAEDALDKNDLQPITMSLYSASYQLEVTHQSSTN